MSNQTNSQADVTKTVIDERIQRQRNLCRIKNYPHFAPSNGICWNCHNQIYERLDGSNLVTGCPFCGTTYCD